MKTLVLVEANKPLVLEEREIPVATAPGEEIIKVIACGVCHSDIHVEPSWGLYDRVYRGTTGSSCWLELVLAGLF